MGLVMAALITGVSVSSVGTAFAGGDHHDGKDGKGDKRIINQENKCTKGADCKNWGTLQDHIFIQVDGKDKKYGGGDGPNHDAFSLSVPQEQNNAGQQQ